MLNLKLAEKTMLVILSKKCFSCEIIFKMKHTVCRFRLILALLKLLILILCCNLNMAHCKLFYIQCVLKKAQKVSYLSGIEIKGAKIEMRIFHSIRYSKLI